MVLESIISAEEVERYPSDMLLLGFSISTLGVWLAYYIFPKEASNWFLFLIAFALEPLLLRLFYIEEREEITIAAPTLWQRHERVIMDYLMLFFGMIFAFSFWYSILPQGLTTLMFKNQVEEVIRIQNLRVAVTGSVIVSGMLVSGLFSFGGVSGLATTIKGKLEILRIITENNLKLLFLFISFSFIFGAGAILLLTWNAAVVGVAIGNLVREGILSAHISQKIAAYFTALPISFLSFFVHGIFEILGYLVGAIAGGILSVCIIRQDYKNPHFRTFLRDVLLLVLAAVFLIVFGAFVEVYITPLL